MDPARKDKLIIGVTWVALSLALLSAFGPTLGHLWSRWFPEWGRPGRGLYGWIVEGESYYTHGPLVWLVSLVVVLLLVRHTSIPVKPCLRGGYAMLAAALLLHLGGSLARVSFVSELAMVGSMFALVLLLWGRRALWRLAFPLAFLLFMVPLPEVTIADINFRFKMLAADWGVQLAGLLGVTVERSGPTVLLGGHKTLVIANVCNGLRTLISLLAFGALYAYVCRLRGFWRLALLAMAVPVAVAANALRIVSLIIVADVWDEKAATGWWHDASGLLIFALAFLLMLSLERLILLLQARTARQPEKAGSLQGAPAGQYAGQWAQMVRCGGGVHGRVACVAIVAAAACAWYVGRPVHTAPDDAGLARAIPGKLVIAGQTWLSSPHELTNRELAILERPSYLYRHYRQAGGGRTVDYCFLFSHDNRKGIHPPDLCVEGFGQGIIEKGNVNVGNVPGRGTVGANELVVQSGSGLIYMLYTYRCGRQYTPSFWRQQAMIVTNGLLGRDAGGGLIRISTSADDSIEAARTVAQEFLRQTLPRLDREL